LGLPPELVQKVTGHRTTDIVLKHYSLSRREEFRRALRIVDCLFVSRSNPIATKHSCNKRNAVGKDR
jgi:hypothetical protein